MCIEVADRNYSCLGFKRGEQPLVRRPLEGVESIPRGRQGGGAEEPRRDALAARASTNRGVAQFRAPPNRHRSPVIQPEVQSPPDVVIVRTARRQASVHDQAFRSAEECGGALTGLRPRWPGRPGEVGVELLQDGIERFKGQTIHGAADC